MSKSYGKELKYRCFSDCMQMGCPGHTIRAIYSNTSDVLTFEVDGKPEYHFDPDMYKAMVEAEKTLQ